jgi:O-acetyl-ADP-ribose deacetylase (regulator of RNase III)
MEIKIVKDDITTIQVDVIVNAANTSLLGGGGVDGAIHRKGGKLILKECQQIRNRQGGCKVGKSVITNAGNLPAKKVIHTVGPRWNNGKSNEETKLKSCYLTVLQLAEEHNLKTIAFPNISTGIYKFPKDKAAQIALDTITDYSSQIISQVIFVCYDQENFEIYNQLLNKNDIK